MEAVGLGLLIAFFPSHVAFTHAGNDRSLPHALSSSFQSSDLRSDNFRVCIVQDLFDRCLCFGERTDTLSLERSDHADLVLRTNGVRRQALVLPEHLLAHLTPLANE